MMRRGARLDPDETGRQLLEKPEHVPTLKLTAKHDIPICIDAMNLKHRLRDIETDGRNRLHDLAPPNRECLTAPTSMALVAPVEEPSTASRPAKRSAAS